MTFTAVIGLEIHAELTTESKIFCSCENGFGGAPNTRCCPVCCGYPGTLPVLNRRVVEYAVTAGLTLDCRINRRSTFDRKNYFYPDLPKGYQITQHKNPVCVDGSVCGVRIKQIHIEEDAGKLVHEDGVTKVDFNRAGVPLIEIVTEPDIRDADTARAVVREIASRLKYAGICNAKMEEGSLRCDVNISVTDGNMSTERTEIKNINSVRAIGKAIEYEIARHKNLLGEGKNTIRETRRYDSEKGVTYPMRSKEEAQDYRYFPEPDIPTLCLTEEEIERLRGELPEPAYKRRERYTANGLTAEEAYLITDDKAVSDIFDSAVSQYPDFKGICSLITGEFFRLSGSGEDVSAVSGKMLADLVRLSNEGKLSKNDAKALLGILCKEGGEALSLAKAHGFIMSQDRGEAEKTVKKVVEANRKAVKEYLDGSEKVMGFLVGQCMRRLGKGANPALVREALEKEIGGREGA